MRTMITKGLTATILTTSAFGAGYVLPNGTILYDGSQDATIYKIDKMTSQQPPVGIASQSTIQVAPPIQVSSVVIEDRTVVYERPIYIRERIIDRNPVYDIVDIAGAVLVYGLLYDSVRHSFFHHELHRGAPYHRYGR
jgi:hypothetical protein